MATPAEISQKYDLSLPYVQEVSRRAQDQLRGLCEDNGYAFIGRVKTKESTAEKIESGRYANWSELDDSFACAVIIPTTTEEPFVLDYLEKRFELRDLRKRGSSLKDPSTFRFDTTRFIARIRPPVGIEPQTIHKINFEIQVRTAFEHAWMSATHAIVYKGNAIDWKKMRLAAQLKAAVEQLDMLISAFDTASGHIHESHWPEVSSKRLIDTLFREAALKPEFPQEILPESWARFCNNYFSLVSSAATDPRRPKPLIDASLVVMKKYFEDTAPAMIPRSLTLLQLCIGVLSREGVLPVVLRGYTPLLSRELFDVFPSTREISGSFFSA